MAKLYFIIAQLDDGSETIVATEPTADLAKDQLLRTWNKLRDRKFGWWNDEMRIIDHDHVTQLFIKTVTDPTTMELDFTGGDDTNDQPINR